MKAPEDALVGGDREVKGSLRKVQNVYRDR